MRLAFLLGMLLLAPFKAYYTRLPFDDGGYTGKYADVVVELGNSGRFVFSREYGYLPYWETDGGKSFVEEIVPRKGDGPSFRPDGHNICSHVAVVENTASRVIIHWRYAPDITSESFTDFLSAYNKAGTPAPFYAEYVDEYFTVYPDGKMEREVKKGCLSLDDWNDSGNAIRQTIMLESPSLRTLSTSGPIVSGRIAERIAGKKKHSGVSAVPIISFSFDEALSGGFASTVEAVSAQMIEIEGVKPYWREGVSGSCLFFDSYSSSVTLPAAESLDGAAFTVSAWVAPYEYPFNLAAIADHMDGLNGYLLGLDRKGMLQLHVGTGEEVIKICGGPLKLYEWSLVSATFDGSSACIYVNGKEVARSLCPGFADAKNAPLTIGKTFSLCQAPLGTERDITAEFRSNMYFSGLIDEVRIYGTAIPEHDLLAGFESLKPANARCFRPYDLPESKGTGKFGARYTKLDYNPAWDGLWRVGPYADVVVDFEDTPWRYVFWRGTRYLPSLVTDHGRSGIWSSDQGPESFPGHCYEHMSDMLCRFSHVRVISGNPARTIVHWRNASVDIKYTWPALNPDGWGIWTDEYWTIYPDGTSVRHQLLHNSPGIRIIEMNQNEILHHPGQTTEDVLLDTAVVTGTPDGVFRSFSRLSGEKYDKHEANILYTNLNSSTKQFQIGESGTNIEIETHKDVWWHGWDHYPAQLIPSDGTVAYTYDRGGSSCVSTFREVRHKLDATTTEAMTIYGLTRLSPEELIPLEHSWNNAPVLQSVSGGKYLGYEKGERAYYLQARSGKLSFTVPCSQASPLVNPCFVVKGMNAIPGKVLVNGEKAAFKAGLEYDTDGSNMLVIWIKGTYRGNCKIVIVK